MNLNTYHVTIAMGPRDTRNGTLVVETAQCYSRDQAWWWTQDAYRNCGLVIRVVPVTD